VDCGKAIEVNPNGGYANACRAGIYLEQKQYDLAWADVHRAQGFKNAFPDDFLERLTKESGRKS
jgi:hypothetical protein